MMEVLTKPAWFGSESQRQLLSLRVMGKVGEKQQQKIPDPGVFFVMFVMGLTPSAIPGSFSTGYYFQFMKAKPQVHHKTRNTQLKRSALKSQNIYTPVPECGYSHTFGSMAALFFRGDYRVRDEDPVRH